MDCESISRQVGILIFNFVSVILIVFFTVLILHIFTGYMMLPLPTHNHLLSDSFTKQLPTDSSSSERNGGTMTSRQDLLQRLLITNMQKRTVPVSKSKSS
ncbi:hypothetical protein JT06_00290 [Desulfobulbus sp. Tol-SR]|nr:hypothetical protein JT06_00290 [Desulfobulbus sp. Tol-SR]